jgi:DNA adenine methylase
MLLCVLKSMPMRQLGSNMQFAMFDPGRPVKVEPFQTGLLKWIGNKQRFAHEIASYFPVDFGTYYEPFIGSGAVLATLAPRLAVGSDSFAPLVGIWQTLRQSPETLKGWYAERWEQMARGPRFGSIREYQTIIQLQTKRG